MKKRILSILLAVAMVITMTPAMGITASATGEYTLKVNATSGTDDIDRENNAVYQTIAGALAKAENGDTIQLDSNITESVVIASEKNITLDLNGYVLKGTGNVRVIENSGTLTIKDSNTNNQIHNFKVDSTDLWILTDDNATVNYSDLTSRPATDTVVALTGGCITGGFLANAKGAGIYNKKNATLSVIGGNIVGNKCGAQSGCGIYSEDSTTLTISGGRLCGNVAGNSTSSFGGGVSFKGSNFTFSGGEISFNRAFLGGGGIYIPQGDFTMRDTAKIRYNAIGAYGGGIYTYSSSPINLLGGEIIGNSTEGTYTVQNASYNDGNGGGVYFGNGKITLGGDMHITSNTRAGIENNAYIQNGKYITIADGNDAPDGMKVGISMANLTGQFTVNGNKTDKQFFTSDNDEYFVKYVDGDTTLDPSNTLYNNHLELAKATVKIDSKIENGSIDVDKQDAATGESATVTATPNKGYELDKITVTDKNGTDITSTVLSGTKITVPADNLPVTVSAAFREQAASSCTYKAQLTAGKHTLLLNAKEVGTFTITGDTCKGFALKDANDKYVALSSDGKSVITQDSIYTWKYDGGLYAENKTTSTSRCWFFKKTTAKTTKNYLSINDSDTFYGPSEIKETQLKAGTSFALSDTKVCALVQITNAEHAWTYKDNKDGTHKVYCTKCDEIKDAKEIHKYENGNCKCGAADPNTAYVSDVDVKEKTVKKTTGFFFWKKTTTSYQYTISPKTQNVKVSKVEYSFDEEITKDTEWKCGSCFTKDSQINTFFIQITDSEGNVTKWLYKDGVVTNNDGKCDVCRILQRINDIFFEVLEIDSLDDLNSMSSTDVDNLLSKNLTVDLVAEMTTLSNEMDEHNGEYTHTSIPTTSFLIFTCSEHGGSYLLMEMS